MKYTIEWTDRLDVSMSSTAIRKIVDNLCRPGYHAKQSDVACIFAQAEEKSVAMRHGRIMVAGAVGTVGSHPCPQVLRRHHDLRCIGRRSACCKGSFAALMAHSMVHVMSDDVDVPTCVDMDETYEALPRARGIGRISASPRRPSLWKVAHG